MREVEQYWLVWILPPYTYLEFIMLTACFFSAHAYLSCGRCRMWHWCEFLGEFGTLNKEAVSHIPGTYGLRCHNSNRHEVLRSAADCQLAGYVDLAYIWGKKWSLTNQYYHWKPRVIMPTLSLLVAPGVVIMITNGVTRAWAPATTNLVS